MQMTAAVSLLVATLSTRAAGLSFSSRAATRGSELGVDLQLMLQRVAICQNSFNGTTPAPASCSESVDTMANYSARMENDTYNQMNESQHEIDDIVLAFETCNNLTADVAGYRSSFREKVASHKVCRTQQSSSSDLLNSCKQLLNASTQNKVHVCGADILTQPIADLQDICTPTAQQPMGQWLESMKETFTTKYGEWQQHNTLCTEAEHAVGNKSAECTNTEASLNNVSTHCEDELKAIETFSCSWATESKSKCNAYETCYESALERFNKAKSAANASVQRWKDILIAAGKMKCMAEAVSSVNNAVNKTRMDECGNPNLTNVSHVKLDIPVVPAQRPCPVPEFYPGSTSYRSQVYSDLPPNLNVRPPTLCLGWKGGCAAHSTFSGSAVYLKLGGKYCGVSPDADKHLVCDDAGKTAFVFDHDSGTCNTGNSKLKLHDGSNECRYDWLGAGPKVGCAGTPGSPTAVATMLSNPLAGGRVGSVSLKFGAPSTASLSPVFTVDMHQPAFQSQFETDWSSTCGAGLIGIESDYSNTDRRFNIYCAQPAAGNPWPNAQASESKTVFRRDFQFECGAGQVISYISSERSNHFRDRRFTFVCRTLHPSLQQNLGGWGLYTNNFAQKSAVNCGPNGFLQGIASKYIDRNGASSYGAGEDRTYRYKCATVRIPDPPALQFEVEYAGGVV